MKTIKDTENIQISMPIKEKGEFVYGLKRNINKKILYAGVLPQWRNFLFVFCFVSGIFLVIALSFFLYQNFNKLPVDIPLIFQQKDKTWATIPKNFSFVLPIIILAFNLLMVYFKGKIFTFDKRLVIILNVAELITYFMIFIGISQLSSLLLI